MQISKKPCWMLRSISSTRAKSIESKYSTTLNIEFIYCRKNSELGLACIRACSLSYTIYLVHCICAIVAVIDVQALINSTNVKLAICNCYESHQFSQCRLPIFSNVYYFTILWYLQVKQILNGLPATCLRQR